MDDPDLDAEEIERAGDGTDATDRSAERCTCGCEEGDAVFEYYATKLRLESESSLIDVDGTVLDAQLPEDLQRALERFLDGATVETLDDWVTEVRQRTGGGAIEVKDLCHERAETDHWGDLDGERYYFTCFFDAVLLAAVTDRRVNIRTESPAGTVIEATATGDGELSVDPPGTLVSFGIATTADTAPDQEPTHEDVYESMCPVVNAFPTPQAYEQWTETVAASTVAVPLEDATELAAALVE